MAIYDAPESLHVGNGVETVFGFNWPYLLPRDLLVTVNGLPVPTVLASPNQVAIVPAPAALSIVRIYRNTPAQNPTYLFATGIPMLPKYIDGNNKQLLYALQEGLLQFTQTQATADEALLRAKAAEVSAANAQESAAQQAANIRRTVRVGPGDPELAILPPVMARALKVMGFDAAGNPVGVVPATGSGTELALDLASPVLGKGTDMLKVPSTGNTLSVDLERGFPGIVLDHATTSWAKIVSADYTVDRAADLANLLDTKKSVVIDTQIGLNARVEVSKTRAYVTCAPGGILLTGPGMAQTKMLRVTGHHAVVDRIDMDNPSMVKASSGGRQCAIEVMADHCTVISGRFRRMLHAVMTESTGEWYMPVYKNNVALDCLGTGPGANDDGSSGLGEDRGDAFLIWGATGIMDGNFAFCMPGQDARIAFHCESLGTGYHTRPNNPARDGFDYWMVNNYAFGNFRRHFAFEAVKRGRMSGNVSGGGATWWPIALTGGEDCLADNMIVLYDRTAANTAGAAWSPARAAIGIGHNGTRNTMRNIQVYFGPGAVGAGLTSLITNNKMTGVVLDGIRIVKPVGQGGLGLVLDNLPDVTCNDCYVSGAQHGITTFGAQDNMIKGFVAKDLTGDAVRLTGGGGITAHARVEGGRFERVNNGVVTNNLTSLSVRGTQMKGVTTADVNQFGTTGAITIQGLHNEDGTGRLTGMGSPFTAAQVRNIGGNLGYTYDFRHTADCFTSAASAVNTNGKFAGKHLTRNDGVMLVALGSTAASPWGVVATSTPITPA